jgi:hypothetical protein
MWNRLRERIETSGVDLSRLERVNRCVRARLGLEPAAYADAYQRPEFYVPGLEARAWHDPHRFEWVERLERACAEIERECEDLQRSGALSRRPEGRGGRWETGHLFFLGEKSRELCEQCPKTTEVVESIPGATAAGLVYFAVLSPGTHLEPHCGPINARLRCHLGLHVPDGCSIRVGAEVRHWQPGRCLVFDDSFEHEVWHRGAEPRTVLVLDIWHPDLTPEETSAIGALMKMASPRSGAARAMLH